MTEATFYDELEPALDSWQIAELERRVSLRGHAGPGKTWFRQWQRERLEAWLRTWDGDGLPVYKPTNTLVPPPLRLEVRFS